MYDQLVKSFAKYGIKENEPTNAKRKEKPGLPYFGNFFGKDKGEKMKKSKNLPRIWICIDKDRSEKSDDTVMGNLLESRLEEAGFETVYSENPDEMLDNLEKSDPGAGIQQVVISTFSPDTGLGERFHKELRLGFATKEIPFIFLPEKADNDKNRQMVSKGNNDYVFKSYDVEYLIREIHAITRSSDRTGEGIIKEDMHFQNHQGESGPLGLEEAGRAVLEDTGEDHKDNLFIPEFHAEIGGESRVIDVVKNFHDWKKTGIIEVFFRPPSSSSGTGSTRASIYLCEGEIADARFDNTRSKKALFRLLREEDAGLNFLERPVTIPKSIKEPFDQLILEAKKEQEALSRLNPASFSDYLEIDREKLENYPEALTHSGLSHVIDLVREHKQVQKVFDMSIMTDLHTYKNLAHLIKKGVVQVIPNKKTGVVFVTDSYADIPETSVHGFGIEVIPHKVIIGGKTYQETEGIHSEILFHLENMKKSKTPLQVDPPSSKMVDGVFRELVVDNDMLCLFTSSGFSGIPKIASHLHDTSLEVYKNIRKIKSHSNAPAKIHIMETGTLSMGVWLLIQETIDFLEKGMDLDYLQEKIQSWIPSVRVFVVPGENENLNHIVKQGGISSSIGDLLGYRPILSVWKGKIIEAERAKGEAKIRNRLLRLVGMAAGHPDYPVRVGVFHVENPENAEELKKRVKESFYVKEMHEMAMGVSCSLLFGSGAYGIAVMPLPE